MVFITHDFLEAIKMGDHIAIMKDGEVSQVGTPEEIVANPKDQYVKDFCEDVPKYKVLSAGKVMRKECSDETKNLFSKKTDCIMDNLKIETLIDKLVDTDKSYPVICNETGDLLGEIDRSIVMRSMKSKS
jgi:glycine betaine/proline transport system ATP-binding protein